MSVQGAIFDFMKTLKPESGDYVPANANQIALQTGHDRDKVNKTFFNLSANHKVELIRGPNGRDIIGYRVLDPGAAPATQKTQRVPRRPHATPSLDKYAQAKERFASMSEQFGELIVATFQENAYAEEGLRLRARLDAIEGTHSDLQRELDEARRDLKYLRGKKQAEIAEGVAKATIAGA